MDDEGEAAYLGAFLNSPGFVKLLQPFRLKAQGGHHQVIKKVRELPIQQYEPSNADHRRLAELGLVRQAEAKTDLDSLGTKATEMPIGRLRGLIRQGLKEPMSEIDAVVQQLL